MKTQAGLEQCMSFINCQLQPAGRRRWGQEGEERRAVTISRQSGAGGHTVAEELAAYLNEHAPKASCSWTIFDRNLVEKVLEDHHLPMRLAQFMPEDRISEMADTMDELFGLHPPSWTLVRNTAETILHLAQLGNVILIGRGANIITGRLDFVFHVRLVGSFDRRVANIQRYEGLSRKAAREFARREDRGRRRYVKKYFHKDVNDPLLYHIVINTDLVPDEEAAVMIGEAVVRQKYVPGKPEAPSAGKAAAVNSAD
ncbi:MAG: AAA family ATPase [Limisphaerales bacterium]